MTPDVFRTRVDKRGRVTIPKTLLEAAGIKPGGQVEISFLGPGRALVEKVKAVLPE